MVAHQAVRVDLHTEHLVDLGETMAELDTVVVDEEHVGSVDTTIHDVMPTILDVRAQWTGHAPIMNKGCVNWGLTPVDTVNRGRGRGCG